MTTTEDFAKVAQKKAQQAAKKLGKSTQRVHKGAAKNINRYSKKLSKDARALKKTAEQNYGKLNHNQKIGLVGAVILGVSLVSAVAGYVSAKKDQRDERRED